VADAIIAGQPLAAGKAMRAVIEEALNLICKHEDKLAACSTKESVRARSAHSLATSKDRQRRP
jgi:hypothetical protein